MRRRMSLLLLLFVLTALPVSADPILLIDPTPRNVNQGDTFSIDIFIRDAVDLFAFQFDLAFDSAFLSAISITEGTFLDPLAGLGGSTFFIPGAIDNLLGTVSFTTNSLLGLGPGVSGSGVLATMNFLSLAAGTIPINFSNVILLDSALSDLVGTTTENGSVIATGTTARVSEPSTLLFVGTGLALSTLRRRRSSATL